MAAQMKGPPLQTDIDDNDTLEEKLTSKGLKVVELYSEWCGPCKSVIPTLRRIRMDREDVAALEFLTVNADKIEYLDSAVDHRGKSQPMFLLFRNGAVKCKIEGANTPKLGTEIMTWTPPNAEMDDLEDNPLYIAKQEKERIARGELPKEKKAAKKK
mmetsp:Transcript_49663/g.108199  ORF Transcript_49663/g.108199 Transcript_49663/m.108199 type:complete len:157 (+) Transcript_49663:62-532(+)